MSTGAFERYGVAISRDQLGIHLGGAPSGLVLSSEQAIEIAVALRHVAEGSSTDDSGLTPREVEVLRFLSAGFSNKEVARRLSCSVRTVETHRLNLRRKTQTGRLKELVSLARSMGLAPA